MNLDRDLGSIDEYLAAFFEDAQLDSQGTFSVDVSRRLTKLSKFQLEQPEKFILPLFSAAVLAGATRFDLSRSFGGYQVVLDRPWCTAGELDEVARAVQDGGVDQGEPRLRHLGVALQMMRSLLFTRISLELEEDVLEIEAGRVRRRRRQRGGEPGLRAQSSLLASLFQSRQTRIYNAIGSWLERRCGWSDMAWTRSGVAGNRPLSWMEAPVAVLNINQGAPGHSPPGGQLVGQLRVDGLPGVRGVALLGEQPSPGSWLISGGLSYPLALKLDADPWHYQVILWCDEIAPDLNYEALLETQLQQLREHIPLWLGALELAPLEKQLHEKGRGALQNYPGVAGLLWRFRQRQMHSQHRPQPKWNLSVCPLEKLGFGCGVTVAEAMQTYARRFGLPVTEQPGDWVLDDGSRLIVLGPDRGVLTMFFARLQPFVVWQGRAVPRDGGPFGLLDYDSFWQCSPLMQDWQLGIQRRPEHHPPTLLRYRNHRFERGESAQALLPQGFTLGVAGQRTPGVEELLPVMDQLLKAAWCDPETQRNEQRKQALLWVWKHMEEAGFFPESQEVLGNFDPDQGHPAAEGLC